MCRRTAGTRAGARAPRRQRDRVRDLPARPRRVVTTWNAGAERLKGYTAPEIIGKHFSTFYTASDQDRNHPDHELEIARREGRYEEEGWRVRKDGSRFWANVVITALFDPAGELVGYGKVTRDLTSRRLSEEQARTTAVELQTANAELEQFRRLVLSVRDYAIFMLDPGGHVATWNAGAEHIKGYTPEEIIGRHFSVFYTDEDRDRSHPARELEIAAREGRYEEEGWRVRKDGSRFWANVLITAVRNEAGVLIGFAKVTRDLTARREAQQALASALEELRRSNEELDQFAIVAAHDLSEPLRTVSGFAELLSREQLSPTGREHLRYLVASTDRMSRLITTLLDYAKAGEESRPVGAVPLARAVGDVLEGLGGAIAERGADVEVRVDPAAAVMADPSDVQLVLQNLIANAVKFGDPDAPRVEVSAIREGDMWRITVSDNGVGIDPADQERIFRAFQRAHPGFSEGTGLGLAICKRVAVRHGGAIGVDSAPGQGAGFWITLPSADDATS